LLKLADVLAHHKSVLLLLVQQLIAFLVTKVAHVADLTEREVVVETSLASPITNSFLVAHFLNVLLLTQHSIVIKLKRTVFI